MKKSILFAVLAGALAFSQLHAQTNRFEKLLLTIDADLQKKEDRNPEEQIRTFTDKKEYLAGETIWLNCFVQVNGAPSILSKTLYAELADENGKIIIKKMLPVENGVAHADLQLPANISSGVYSLNCYTWWMRNFPWNIVPQQLVVIGTDFTAKPFRLLAQEKMATGARIVPEGGCIAYGTETNFVVSLYGNNTLPVADTFFVSDNDKPVVSGRTALNGLCKISFTPQKNRTYKVHCGSFMQPVTLEGIEGISFKATTSNPLKLFISLDKSTGTTSNQFLVAGICNDAICYQSVFDFAADATAAAIPRNKLPTGLIEFLVFDENEMIVASRKVYNAPPATALLTMNPGSDRYSITVGQPVKAGFVTALGPHQPVLYTPELQAVLDDPSNDEWQMLQTPPPFALHKKWELILMDKLSYFVESGITIRGKVSPFAGKPSEDGYEAELMIRGEDSSRVFSKAKTFANGEFTVTDAAFGKEGSIYFQGHNPKNMKELLDVKLYPGYFDTLSRTAYQPAVKLKKDQSRDAIPSRMQAFLDSVMRNDPNTKTLEEVIVKGKARSKLDSLKQTYLSPIFDDGAAQVLIPDEGNYISIWQFLRNAVPGLKIDGDLLDPVVSFSRYNAPVSANNTGEDLSEGFGSEAGILFFVNEIQVSKDIVNSISVEDVALVTVNKQPSGALGAYNGYIAIFTKKGVTATAGRTKGLAAEKRAGYSVIRNGVNELPLSGTVSLPATTLLHQQLLQSKAGAVLTLPGKSKYTITLAGWDASGKFLYETRQIN